LRSGRSSPRIADPGTANAIPSQKIDLLKDQWREPRHVAGLDAVAFRLKLLQGSIDYSVFHSTMMFTTSPNAPSFRCTGTHAECTGPNPKCFGYERGVTYYNLISDQFTGLNAIVVPSTLRDSLSLLAVALEQPTELNSIEIMTDTSPYTDVVFGVLAARLSLLSTHCRYCESSRFLSF
jgi:hypothetical protein